MHVVTKFLVLLAAFLAVLVAGFTISYSLNADTIVSDFERLKLEKETAVQELVIGRSTHNEERGQLQTQISTLDAELTNRNEDVKQLQAEVAQLRTEKRSAELRAEATLNQIGQWGETTRVQAEMIDAYRVEIGKLRDLELASREQMILLEDAINDAESRNEVLVQQTRALQEQLKEIENQIAAGGAGPGDRGGVMLGALRNIKGRVVEAQFDTSTQQTLVEVDVGENDGVEEGMVMAAYRGRDTYIGSIEIIRVDLQTAVGRVRYYADPDYTLVAGDSVATNIR